MLKVGLQNYSGGTAALPHSALEVVCAERCTVTLHYSETVFSNWPGNEATHCYAECMLEVGLHASLCAEDSHCSTRLL